MQAINDGYRGLQVVVSLNSDRMVFVCVLLLAMAAGPFAASLLGALN